MVADSSLSAVQNAIEADDPKRLAQIVDSDEERRQLNINRVWTYHTGPTNLLSFAALNGSLHCLLYLLSRDDTLLNRCDGIEFSPLEIASLMGRAKCVAALLKTKQVDLGQSLTLASNHHDGASNVETVRRLLLYFSGETDMMRYKIKRALLACAKSGCGALLIADRRCSPEGALLRTSFMGWTNLTEQVLRSTRVDVNVRGMVGTNAGNFMFSPLMIAAHFGHTGDLKLLLDSRNIDVMATCSTNGKTALQLAREAYNMTCVIVLAERERDRQEIREISIAIAAEHDEQIIREFIDRAVTTTTRPAVVSPPLNCVICMSAAACQMIVPCNHLCVCATCLLPATHRGCPMCRGPVHNVVRVFIA